MRCVDYDSSRISLTVVKPTRQQKRKSTVFNTIFQCFQRVISLFSDVSSLDLSVVNSRKQQTPFNEVEGNIPPINGVAIADLQNVEVLSAKRKRSFDNEKRVKSARATGKEATAEDLYRAEAYTVECTVVAMMPRISANAAPVNVHVQKLTDIFTAGFALVQDSLAQMQATLAQIQARAAQMQASVGKIRATSKQMVAMSYNAAARNAYDEVEPPPSNDGEDSCELSSQYTCN
eukprot:scaffold6397_cov175-Ochromonas_danica.AAC.14